MDVFTMEVMRRLHAERFSTSLVFRQNLVHLKSAEWKRFDVCSCAAPVRRLKVEMEESEILADLSVLDFYLHRSIQLRIEHQLDESEESFNALKQAKQFSVIVEEVLKSLVVAFDGSYDDIPFDEVLQQRLQLGAILGLLFDHGPEDDSRWAGYAQALTLLLGLARQSQAESTKNAIFQFAMLHLMHASLTLQEALQTYDDNFASVFTEEAFIRNRCDLEALVKVESFERLKRSCSKPAYVEQIERNLLEVLARIYGYLEPPLIVKMSSRRSSLMVKHTEEEPEQQQPSPDFYTQAPILDDSSQFLPEAPQQPSQGPGVLLPSTQSGIDLFTISPAILPRSSPEDEQRPALETLPELLESSQFLEPTQPILEPTQPTPGGREETNEPIRIIPLEVLKGILKLCGQDREEFLTTKDPVLEEAYKKYNEYTEALQKEEKLPPMHELLPKDSSPVQVPKKKRLTFESRPDFESQPVKKGKKKSLLLPDPSARVIEWSSQATSPGNKDKENSLESTHTASADSSQEKPQVQKARTDKISNSQKADSLARDFDAKRRREAAATEYVPPRHNVSEGSNQRGRLKWDEHEIANLKDGLRRYGRKWSVILASYKFKDRTSVDLKDKARNLAKRGEIVLPPS